MNRVGTGLVPQRFACWGRRTRKERIIERILTRASPSPVPANRWTYNPKMRLRTLGKLELEGSELRRSKPLLLLTYLALEGPQERRRLAELFWFGSADPLNNLGTTLARIGNGAQGAVERDEIQIWTVVTCDALELVEAHNQGDAEACVALYQGTFLEGVRPQDTSSELEEWFYSTREALGGRVRQALLGLAGGHAGVGEFSLGAELAQRAYGLPGAPRPEPSELEWLFLLLTAGERGEAFEVRREATDFGLELNLSVWDAQTSLREDRGRTTTGERHNLPVQPTRFVGRSAEKAKVAASLLDPDCRILTIMGPGGFGKTRLAIEVAREQLGRFADGVFFVPLASVNAPTSLPFAIADALGMSIEGAGDVKELLLRYLAERQSLLVLDNFEHLLEGTDLIHDLWEHTRNVKLLVTSRERLNLRAERVFVLSGLMLHADVPREPSDAVRLFRQTAKDRGHEAALSESSAPSVVRICELVGGMPLAIELAASWLHVLQPSGIVEQLEEGLGVLEGQIRDALERQRSLRTVFDRSWELLSDVERGVFRRLSAFQGGFNLRAAREVAGASLGILSSLSFKSLLMVTPAGRYEQHPLVHEYARERLVEHPEERSETMEKHQNYYLTLLQERYPDLSSSKIKETRKLLVAELPNILAAWDSAIENRQLVHIKNAVFPLHVLFGVESREREAVELFSRAAASLDESNREHHAALGYLLIGQGATVEGALVWAEEARSLLTRGLALLRPLGEDLGVAWALSFLTFFRFADGVEAEARAFYQEGFPIARRVGSNHLLGRYISTRLMFKEVPWEDKIEGDRKLYEETIRELREVGSPYHLIGPISQFGRYLISHQSVDEGKALLSESLELAREYQRYAFMSLLGVSADFAVEDGDLDEAEALLSEALQVARDIGSTSEVWALGELGLVAMNRGNISEAEGLCLEALRIAREIKDPWSLLQALSFLAILRIEQGHAAAAAEWYSFIVHHPEARHMRRVAAQSSLDRLRDKVSPEELDAAVERGKELTSADIVDDLLAN